MMYREQLDGLSCDDPCCADPAHGPMDLYAHCHPEAATWTAYHRDLGAVVIRCTECDEPLLSIAIASKRDRRARHGRRG
jgi:hypothetical protein